MNKYLELTDGQLIGLGYRELLEAKKELESAEKLDVDKYNIVVNALAEKAPEQSDAEIKLPEYEFIDQIDFDAVAKTGTNLLNNIVQSFLNKVRSQSALQSAEKDAQLREKDEIIDGNEAQITNLSYQNKSLQETVSELSNYKLNNEDYKTRFEAAASKMNEYEQEIERLKRRESELQQQIANAPAPTARQPIDITADTDINALIAQANELKNKRAAEEEENWKASRIKVTNIRWEDSLRQINYLAERVDTGETISFNRLEKGKYMEVSAEEAERFRAEAAAASQTPIVESSPLVTEVPEIPVVEQFREEDTVRYDVTLDPSAIGEALPAPRNETLEEAFRRIEALEQDVKILTSNWPKTESVA